MAKLDRMPDRPTIVAMRGKVDYYYWKGIPVARAWPKKGNQPNNAQQVRNRQAFATAAKVTGAVPAYIKAIYDYYIRPDDGVTWVDAIRSQARTGDWTVRRS